MIKEFNKYNPLLSIPGDLVSWCIRFELNKITMIHKNMQLEMIITKLRQTYPLLYIVYTPENSDEVIIRIYMRRGLFKNNINLENITYVGEQIMETIIRGIEGVITVNVVELIRSEFTADGGIKQDS